MDDNDEPRNSPRRKCLAKAIGLLHLAWGELPQDEKADRAGDLILQAVDETWGQMDGKAI